MLPNGKPVLMALLVAYCAMASPINTRPGAVQAVLDALKAQLKADDISHATTLVDEAEASLWADGVLNDDIVAKLEQEIQAMTIQDGISVDTIAEQTTAYLNARGAADELNQKRAEIEVHAPDSATIKEVIDHAVNNFKRGGQYTCPDGSQASFCCAVM